MTARGFDTLSSTEKSNEPILPSQCSFLYTNVSLVPNLLVFFNSFARGKMPTFWGEEMSNIRRRDRFIFQSATGK